MVLFSNTEPRKNSTGTGVDSAGVRSAAGKLDDHHAAAGAMIAAWIRGGCSRENALRNAAAQARLESLSEIAQTVLASTRRTAVPN